MNAAPLTERFDSHGFVRRLHDVPPHEVHEVRVDGRRAVAKFDTGPTGNASVEGRVMAFVGEHTSVPVPDVLARGSDFYVAAWHPDAPEPEADGTPTPEWARAAGRGLATLHAETGRLLDSYGQFRASGDLLDGRDDWHEAARDYVRGYRPTLTEHGHGDVADAVLDCLDAHPGVFAGAGDPVCCHGWATPEHVAVRDGEVACVVDFEHAIAAPGEFDYWRTVLPAFDGGAVERAFRAGYESVRDLPDGFERRRPAYALLCDVYYLVSLHVQAQHGPAKTEEIASHLRESVFERLDAL